jgi:hypothetical protein
LVDVLVEVTNAEATNKVPSLFHSLGDDSKASTTVEMLTPKTKETVKDLSSSDLETSDNTRAKASAKLARAQRMKEVDLSTSTETEPGSSSSDHNMNEELKKKNLSNHPFLRFCCDYLTAVLCH